MIYCLNQGRLISMEAMERKPPNVNRSQPEGEVSRVMKHDWDERAIEDARWYINTLKRDQTDEEFGESGRPDVENFVFSDPTFIAGADLRTLRLLEIGCGIGRMTQHLAAAFAEVHGTDVSGEMIRQARARLAPLPNVHLYETNGCDFRDLPSDYFDRIFSVHVFQHVPDAEVIRSNIRDAGRTLKPGGFFKLQTWGVTLTGHAGKPTDTWSGASFPEREIRRIALESDLKLVSVAGSGTLLCWTILRKQSRHEGNALTTAIPDIEFVGRADEPQNKRIARGGDSSGLAILVRGLTDAADANNVVVDVSGADVQPFFVGALNTDFVAAARAEGIPAIELLTQVNVSIPESVSSGTADVRVKMKDSSASRPAKVELLSPMPVLPRIYNIGNAVDGGVDVHGSGERSRFRVLVLGLNESAHSENVRVHVGGIVIVPTSVEFVPSAGLHVVFAQLPDGIAAGPTCVQIQFGDLVSTTVDLTIIARSLSSS